MNKEQQVMSDFNQFIELVSHWKNNCIDFGEGIILYRGEIHILFMIGNIPGIFSSEIARRFGVTRAVIYKSILKLEKQGFLKKETDSQDKKRYQHYLTAKGKKAYAAHEKFMKAHDSYMYDYLHTLSQSELNTIITFLLYAQNMIKNHF